MKIVLCVLSLISLLITVCSAGKHDVYAGYSVYGIVIQSEDDQKLLHQLEHELSLDTWQHGFPKLRDAHVMVAPLNKDTLLQRLEQAGLSYYALVQNVPRILEEHDAEISRWRSKRGNRLMPFEDFPRYSEVNEYMERIATEYPDLVTLVNAGTSFEGRDIKYLKISTSSFADESKPIYFIDATIHAREWVTTPVALYAIHRLVEDIRDADSDLLQNLDWIILPIVNPDGFEYTHTDYRLWRRTRSTNPEVNITCFGVDANRNFDVSFNTLGVSSDPCDDTYPGDYAFSEPETRIIRDMMHEHVNRTQMYLALHSYGNYVLWAYGDRSMPNNAVSLHHVGATMGAAMDSMKLPQADYYIVGNSASVLYYTSGSARDYSHSIGIPFTYTLELPSLGYFFEVPPQYIEHINEETWRGIVDTARLCVIHYKARYGL